MTRKEILKELELWPLWTLRQPLPDLTTFISAEPTESSHSQQRKPLHYANAEIADDDIADLDGKSLREAETASEMLFQCYETDGGLCVAVHQLIALSKDERLLWDNICRAMRLPMRLVENAATINHVTHKNSAKVIILIGESTAQQVLNTTESLEVLRGKPLTFADKPCVATYDLAYLLQNSQDKAKAWDDFCLVLDLMQQA